MWPRPDLWDRAVRSGPRWATRLVVSWPDGRSVPPLVPIGGEVQVSSAPGVRRTLSASVVDTGVEWDALEPAGAVVSAQRGLVFVDGSTAWVPLGVFRVDEQSVSVGDGQVQITAAPDRWAVIQDRTFESPEVPQEKTFVGELCRLLSVASPTVRVLSSRDRRLPASTVYADDSRERAIYQLAEAMAFDVAFAPDGVAEIADGPTTAAPTVWTFDSGSDGVLSSLTRTRGRQSTRNVVIVSTVATDGTYPFPPVTVEDARPGSPTYARGPFGRHPLRVESDVLTNEVDARFAGDAILARTVGLQSRLSLTAVPQPALDVLDSVSVVTPPQPGQPQVVSAHIIDTLTFPLDTGVMSATTRAIGPVDSGDGDATEVRSLLDVYRESPSLTAVRARFRSVRGIAQGRVGA